MLNAFTAGLLMITVAELLDKTFFISMIMAMRHPRRWVLVGAIAALALMTILSVGMGQLVTLLPKLYTQSMMVVLFIGFGVKLLVDAWRMVPTVHCEALNEAEATIAQNKPSDPSKQLMWSVIVETFVLTFLAEWGDRTQFSTMALAAQYHPIGVTVGAILGHAICAVIAVMGGQWIAGRISERMLTALGGVLFLIFAAVAVREGSV